MSKILYKPRVCSSGGKLLPKYNYGISKACKNLAGRIGKLPEAGAKIDRYTAMTAKVNPENNMVDVVLKYRKNNKEVLTQLFTDTLPNTIEALTKNCRETVQKILSSLAGC